MQLLTRLRSLPLTVKVVLLNILVGLVVWAVLDRVASGAFHRTFKYGLVERLNENALEDRLRFDRYVNSHAQLVKITIGQKRFIDYLDNASNLWLSPPAWQRGPVWFPNRSILRFLTNPGYVFLLDDQFQVVERYRRLNTDPPAQLLEPHPLLLKKSKGISHISIFNGHPYLISSGQAENGVGQPFWLLLATPIDERLLNASLGDIPGRLVALVAENTDTILVSNSKDQLPPGSTMESVRDKYLVTGSVFHDYGDAELLLNFTSFIERERFESTTMSFVAESRMHQALTVVVFLCSLTMIMLWVARRIGRLTEQMQDFSRKSLAGVGTPVMVGDELDVLRQSFQRLTAEVLVSHDLIRHETRAREGRKAELDRQAKQLKMLKSVTTAMKVGVLIKGKNRFWPVNDQMNLFENLVGGLEPFTDEDGREERTILDTEGKELVFQILHPEIGLDEEIVLVREITEQKRAGQEIDRRIKTQAVFNDLLKSSLESISLSEMLEKFIVSITSLPWLEVEPKGAIFLKVEGERQLVMRAERGLGLIKDKCASIPFGHCLCGRAAKSGQVLFANHVDDQHDVRYEGMPDHGHYCLPIFSSANELLGVFTLYIRADAQHDSMVEETLMAIVKVIAGAIERKRAEEEKHLLQDQLLHTQKLEAIGQLAAGIAHEINTPTQYIGDNLRFCLESFEELLDLQGEYEGLVGRVEQGGDTGPLAAKLREKAEDIDLGYLVEEIPKALQQSMEGNRRVGEIVGAMKEFSHPGIKEKACIDINRAIQSTILVARNEWKYVAQVRTELDEELPEVICLPGEINQVILNMIVNAAHAIEEGGGPTDGQPGEIVLATRLKSEWAEISIADNGPGMSEEVRRRIFDPFFTTKGVGKGTGQGLAIAHSVVVDKHHGVIEVESAQGRGTTFTIKLPLTAETVIHTEQG